MRKEQIINFRYGIYGGLVLFTVGFLRSILPYLNIDSSYYFGVIRISLISTLLITVFFLIKKQNSILGMCSRSIVILISYICFFLLGATTGLMHFLYDLVPIPPSSSSGNISGLLWLTSYISIVCVCVSMISLKALLLGVVKLRKALQKRL